MYRSFTLDSVYRNGTKLNSFGGRFVSSSPSNAAKKVFSHIYRDMNIKGRISLEIHIRETSRNSSRNIYKYKVSKTNKIKEVIRNGTIIRYKYITKIKSLN